MNTPSAYISSKEETALPKMPQKTLSKAYPWTQTPLIANAPMAGFAKHELACAVTKAGGLGFIGSIVDMGQLEADLEKASGVLSSESKSREGEEEKEGWSFVDGEVLPVGVGFLPFVAKLSEAAAVVEKFRPAVVWFFAAVDNADYKTWTEEMRKVSPKTQIWIQIGSVTAALSIAQSCSPDVLVMQGLDAGGHGYEKGCSIISLVPETIDALTAHGLEIPVVASGGIVDGRGVAAALALGAKGVVMGTGFLAAKETVVPHEGYRKAVLQARDGGQATVRDKVFDELRGPNIWPVEYDGRSIVTTSYKDSKSGVGLEEVRTKLAAVEKSGSMGFGAEGEKRATIWCGAGVGLVNEMRPAKAIIEEVREGARRVLKRANL
jgi:nitronate monooxygenase